MNEDTRPRGRPRPDETVGRDDRIFSLLEGRGPLTRNEIAEITGLSPSLTYLSLARLKKDERIRPCLKDGGEIVWSTGVGSPCP